MHICVTFHNQTVPFCCDKSRYTSLLDVWLLHCLYKPCVWNAYSTWWFRSRW